MKPDKNACIKYNLITFLIKKVMHIYFRKVRKYRKTQRNQIIYNRTTSDILVYLKVFFICIIIHTGNKILNE